MLRHQWLTHTESVHKFVNTLGSIREDLDYFHTDGMRQSAEEIRRLSTLDTVLGFRIHIHRFAYFYG